VVRGCSACAAATGAPSPPTTSSLHVISELTIEAVGIALTANPRLVAELYPHMAEPICQHCGAPTDCNHLGHELHELAA
jgi:hypothetical protein